VRKLTATYTHSHTQTSIFTQTRGAHMSHYIPIATHCSATVAAWLWATHCSATFLALWWTMQCQARTFHTAPCQNDLRAKPKIGVHLGVKLRNGFPPDKLPMLLRCCLRSSVLPSCCFVCVYCVCVWTLTQNAVIIYLENLERYTHTSRYMSIFHYIWRIAHMYISL